MKKSKDVIIDSEFTENSFTIKIYNLNGKNYRFGVAKTFGSIQTEGYKIKKKHAHLGIHLLKKETRAWTSLNWKAPEVYLISLNFNFSRKIK